MNTKGLQLSDDVNIDSPTLDYIRRLEPGTDPELSTSYSHAYYLLMKGKLEEAVEQAKNSEDEQVVLILSTASDEAKAEWIKSVLELKPEEVINDNAIFSILGLAIKENKNLTNYNEFIDNKSTTQFDMIFEFIKLVQAGQFEKADEIVVDVNLWMKGELYAMAYVAKEC
jgi:hypothetical protein